MNSQEEKETREDKEGRDILDSSWMFGSDIKKGHQDIRKSLKGNNESERVAVCVPHVMCHSPIDLCLTVTAVFLLVDDEVSQKSISSEAKKVLYSSLSQKEGDTGGWFIHGRNRRKSFSTFCNPQAACQNEWRGGTKIENRDEKWWHHRDSPERTIQK